MNIPLTLSKLGLTNNEVKTYLALVKIGKSKAGRISKECGIDRSSTYDALKKLLEKGLVSYIVSGKIKYFSPAPPNKLVDYFKEKEMIAEQIAPELAALYGETKEKEDVTLFKGWNGVKTVFEDILNTMNKGEEYYVLGSEGHMTSKMSYYQPIFSKKKKMKQIKSKILIREGRDKKSSKFTQRRAVPTEIVSTITTNIYKNKIALILWSETPEAILIENKAAADTWKNYFDLMWKGAKKV